LKLDHVHLDVFAVDLVRALHGDGRLDHVLGEASPFRVPDEPEELLPAPDGAAAYGDLPPEATSEKSYRTWKRDIADRLYRTRRYEIFKYAPLKLYSEPGESEREFRIRIADRLRELRDEKVEKLRDRLEARIRRAEEALRKAEQRLEREQEQAGALKMNTLVNVGATVLSAFLGRKKASLSSLSRATTTVRGMGRTQKERRDVKRAMEDVEAREEKIRELEAELQQ
jgi:prefoldin subunit 5